MAGDTLRRESLKLPHRRALVTFLALHRSVRTEKRKAVLMILHLLHRDIPSPNRVTLCAIRSEFPPVNIRVTIRAIFSHVRKNRLHVTLRALHSFVHRSQRIVCVVVIEFWMCTDRPPSRCRMAIFTRDRQRPVWAAGSLSLGEGGKRHIDKAQNEQSQKLDNTRRKVSRDPRTKVVRGRMGPIDLNFEIC